MKYSKFLLIFFALFFGILGKRCDLHVKRVASNDLRAAFDHDGNGKFNNSSLNGLGKLEDVMILTEFNQDIDIEIPDRTVYFQHIFDECTWRKIIVTVKTVDKQQSKGKDKLLESSRCVPMVDENVIKVNVRGATKNCPIKVVGAKRWFPQSSKAVKPTTPKISAPPPSTFSGSSGVNSENDAVWTVTGIFCGILLLSIGAGFGYWIYRTQIRRKGGKKYGRKIKAMPPKSILQTSAPVLKQKPSTKVTKEPTKAETKEICITKLATAETEDKKEGAPMPEVTAEEEIQNDPIIQSPSPSSISEEVEPVEEPVEANFPQLPPLFSAALSSSSPKASKNGSPKSSQQTVSLPATSESSTLKKDKIEAHYASLLRLKCLGNNNSASSKAREMRRRYPRNAGRELQHREIKFCSSSIGEMFLESNKMCCDAERDLKSYGIGFDEKKGITRMTEAGRAFIQDSKTPNFIAYFAFGAEYHEFLNLDVQEFPKLSIPLLFAIAMIPRFDDQKRRKALSWIRRQIQKVRDSFSVAERDEMGFPVNAFEKAYEMSHQKGVESLDNLKTMGRQLMEDKRQRDCQKAAQNRVAGRMGRKKRKALKDLLIKYV